MPLHLNGYKRAERPRNVLFVSNASAFSGAEDVLCTIYENLDPKRFKPSALIGMPGHLASRLQRARGSTIIAAKDFSLPTIESLRVAADAISALKPNIAHVNGVIGFPLLAALRLADIPFVQHVHVVDQKAYAEQCASAHTVIAVSRFVAQELSRLNLHPSRIRVLPNSVDCFGRFNPGKQSATEARRLFGLPTDSFVLLYPARHAPAKRHTVLISALSQMVQRGEEVHLVLAGETLIEPNVYDHVWQLVKAHNLAHPITEFPFVEDMPALYAASDALVFPAEHEPFGLCILEAMAMGIPVIAARSGGIPEFVTDGLTGLLFEPGNVGELVQAITALKDKQEIRGRVSNAATEYVRAQHCTEAYIESVAGLYDQVLTGIES